jgi:hypothetical protein
MEYVENYIFLSTKTTQWIYDKVTNEIIYQSNQSPLTNSGLKEVLDQKIGYEKKSGVYSILFSFFGSDSNFYFQKKKPKWKSEPLKYCNP